MKIGFDAKRLFLNNTGLGNYSRFVVDSLIQYFPDNHYFLYSPKTENKKSTAHYFQHPHIHIVKPKGVFNFIKSLWRSYFISFDKSIHDLDIFHGLSHELPIGLPQHVKKILTIHDVIFLHYPHLFNSIDVWIYKQKLISSCKIADVIVAISEQTKQDIISFLGVDSKKIKVIYQGCNQVYFTRLSDTEKETIKKKYNLPDEYILNVGSIEERKNVGLLVEALSKIAPSKRPHVVLIGKRTAYTKQVEKLIKLHQLDNSVHILPYISFEDLPGIYQQAKLFAYTSIIEGFGIPILEAMVSEIPVLVPDGSCFREVVGPNGTFFKQGDAKNLANKIELLIDADNSQMIEGQKIYAKKFFEDSIQKLYHEIYLGEKE